MFFDLTAEPTGDRTVNLNDITGFGRARNVLANSPDCTTRSLTIVIQAGNATLNSNQQLAASLFLTSTAPYGQVSRANGTADFIGTIFADTVNMVGNVDFSTDTCFLSNVSPALLGVTRAPTRSSTGEPKETQRSSSPVRPKYRRRTNSL